MCDSLHAVSETCFCGHGYGIFVIGSILEHMMKIEFKYADPTVHNILS